MCSPDLYILVNNVNALLSDKRVLLTIHKGTLSTFMILYSIFYYKIDNSQLGLIIRKKNN